MHRWPGRSGRGLADRRLRRATGPLTSPVAGSVAEVADLFGRWGNDPYDEEVGQLDHALQTAALAASEGASDDLIAAALLHDVGHLLELEAGRGPSDDDRRHEHTGPAWLRPLFPATVTGPIALHVMAKRYLCAVEPAYVHELSAGSVRSLEAQGGPLSPQATARFERLPWHVESVRIRRWDDAGKAPDGPLRRLEDHLELLRRVAL